MFKHDVWCVEKQRIGDNPYMQIVDKIEGIDIDYPEDFAIAQVVMEKYNHLSPPPPPIRTHDVTHDLIVILFSSRLLIIWLLVMFLNKHKSTRSR
jgi:hypothetical protein